MGIQLDHISARARGENLVSNPRNGGECADFTPKNAQEHILHQVGHAMHDLADVVERLGAVVEFVTALLPKPHAEPHGAVPDAIGGQDPTGAGQKAPEAASTASRSSGGQAAG